MSKVIDRSDLSKLSQEDLEYLRVRGQLTPTEEQAYVTSSLTAPEGIPFEDRPNTGDVGPVRDEQLAARRVAADRAGMVLGGTPAAPGQPVDTYGAVPPDVSEEDGRLGPDDYEDASKKELQQELRSRGLPFPGNANKDRLTELLEEDDEDEDEDEGE